MKISVILAVYNGQDFIEKALSSCHGFECVKEIVLVDDGSTDNSYNTALTCKEKYSKLRVFHHEGFQNKGAGASWNLGILKASYDWIAILGVDDFFLPNRFDKELELYKSGEDFDGVHGALGVHYYSKGAERKFRNQFGENYMLTSVRSEVKPKELKYVLLGMHPTVRGYFSLDALTVKKEALIKIGLFNEKLRLHQDTDIIIKLSCVSNLLSGEIHKPIALRGVHEENRITNNARIHQTRFLLYKELFKWVKEQVIDDKIRFQVYNRYKYFEYLVEKKSTKTLSVLFYTFKHPSIFFNDQAFFKFIDLSKIPQILKTLVRKTKKVMVILFFNRYYKKYKTNELIN